VGEPRLQAFLGACAEHPGALQDRGIGRMGRGRAKEGIVLGQAQGYGPGAHTLVQFGLGALEYAQTLTRRGELHLSELCFAGVDQEPLLAIGRGDFQVEHVACVRR